MRGADIVVEASRLEHPEPLLRTAWIEPGALVIPYGTMSAVELSLLEIADKVVVDDWGQCATGRLGSLRAHVDAGLLTRDTLHAELGEVVAGTRPGRERAGRDDRPLAPRAQPVRHRARARDAREGAPDSASGQTLRYR